MPLSSREFSIGAETTDYGDFGHIDARIADVRLYDTAMSASSISNFLTPSLDYDLDGLNNKVESTHNCNPTNSDTDYDGLNDKTEVDAGSDPCNSNSYPAAISGAITYSGSRTGLIHVVAVTDSNSWSTVYSATLSQPGSYSITNVPNLANYWVKAWRDSDGNGANDNGEVQNVYGNNPLYLASNVSGIDLSLNKTYYVSLSGNHTYPYNTWATAATNIQVAIDVSIEEGDTVLVTNGVYDIGGAVTPGGSLTNRIVVTNAITVKSVNGPDVTLIVGRGAVGTNAVRCAYLANQAVLSGFTLTNGFAADLYGGGAYAFGATLTNCWIVGNEATDMGGGVCGGTLYNCVIRNNLAEYGGGALYGMLYHCTISENEALYGGGVIECTLNDCIISNNTAIWSGGGAHENSTLYNCLVKGNSASVGGGASLSKLMNSLLCDNRATSFGGGAYHSELMGCTVVSNIAGFGGGVVDGYAITNTVIYFNTATNSGNNWYYYQVATSASYCCTYPALDGEGNITNDPQFADLASGDYHLEPWSPCIDAGFTRNDMTNDVDSDGSNRVLNGIVDMGAYECPTGRFDVWLESMQMWSWATFGITNRPASIHYQWIENSSTIKQDWTSLPEASLHFYGVAWNSTNQLIIGEGSNHTVIKTITWVQDRDLNSTFLSKGIPRTDWAGEIGSNVWRKTVNLDRDQGWDRFYLSSDPNIGQGWPHADGLQIKVSAPSGGSTTYDLSPSDSVDITDRIPTNGIDSVTIELIYTGGGTICLDRPIYLLKWRPNVALTWPGGAGNVYIAHESDDPSHQETFDVHLTSLPPNSGDFTNIVVAQCHSADWVSCNGSMSNSIQISFTKNVTDRTLLLWGVTPSTLQNDKQLNLHTMSGSYLASRNYTVLAMGLNFEGTMHQLCTDSNNLAWNGTVGAYLRPTNLTGLLTVSLNGSTVFNDQKSESWSMSLTNEASPQQTITVSAQWGVVGKTVSEQKVVSPGITTIDTAFYDARNIRGTNVVMTNGAVLWAGWSELNVCTGAYTVTWSNPAPDKTLLLDGGSSPVTWTNQTRTLTVTTNGMWLSGDSIAVTLSNSLCVHPMTLTLFRPTVSVPSHTNAIANGSNITISAATDSPSGVTWSLTPLGTGDATWTNSGSTNMIVTPGTVPTGYVYVASSADDPTISATGLLDVCWLEISPAVTNIDGKALTNCTLGFVNSYFATNDVTWYSSPEGLAGMHENDTHFWFNPSNSVSGSYTVSAWITGFETCMSVATVNVLKVDIEQRETNTCVGMTNATLNLTSNSYWASNAVPSGTVQWDSTPSGLAKTGSTDTDFWFNPSNSVPGTYVVRAYASLLTDCFDTCTVRVYRVEINPAVTNVNGNTATNCTLGLVNSYYGTAGVTWDSSPAGLANVVWTNDTFSFNPSNSTPTNYTIRAWITGYTNCMSTATANVCRVDVATDANRDLAIDFNNPQDTTQGTNIFWLNDDYDCFHYEEGEWHEDDFKQYLFQDKNWEDDTIGYRGLDETNGTPATASDNCLRDLEDFTVVQLKVPGVVSNLTGITYWLKFDNVTSGNPKINLFKAITNGVTTPFDYLTNGLVATNQALEMRAYTIDSTEHEISTNYINLYDQPIGLLLEGCTAGKGFLTFIVKKDGSELCRSSVLLELHPITEFYDKFKVGLVEHRRFGVLWTYTRTKWNAEVQAAATQIQTNNAYTSESDKYFLFVHGWNVDDEDKKNFAETAFKRLWWQKYKGGFGMFDWPTLYGFNLDGISILSGISPNVRQNFDNSEMIAWLSGTSLAQLMQNLNTSGQLRVLAHSQGNAVMAEALRKYNGAQKIKTYIATQAAIGGSFYSQTGTSTDFDGHGPDTPNIFAYWNTGDATTTNQPLFVGNSNKVDRMCNYYNLQDYALTRGWEMNNRWRPDDSLEYGFGYGGSITNYDVTESATATNRFYRWWGYIEGLSITNTADLRTRYEVFSYCAESRLMALGRTANSGFPYVNRNLEDVPLKYDDAHYSHSREFRSNITKERAFFEYIMNDGNF